MARWLVETLQNQAEPGGIWRTVADSPEAWGWVCVHVADIIKGGLNLAPFGTDHGFPRKSPVAAAREKGSVPNGAKLAQPPEKIGSGSQGW